MENKLKTLAVLMVLLVPGIIVCAFLPAPLHAEYNSITQTDVGTLKTSALTAPSGVYTFATFMAKQPDNPKTGLSRTISQAALFQGTGTSPTYKVEVLCSMDGIVFTKPETGGDLGTFTDGNAHYVSIHTPLSPGGHRLKFTETGASNSVTWTLQEAGQ